MKILGAARWVTAIVLILSATGCGYRLTGTGASLIPDHVRKIVIRPFENRTARTEIEQRVTEEVARELSRRGRWDVVTDRGAADAMLELDDPYTPLPDCDVPRRPSPPAA